MAAIEPILNNLNSRYCQPGGTFGFYANQSLGIMWIVCPARGLVSSRTMQRKRLVISNMLRWLEGLEQASSNSRQSNLTFHNSQLPTLNSPTLTAFGAGH